jgi:hypothetical protein
LALDSAHRAAQASQVGVALRDACCSTLLYNALAWQCGRTTLNVWALADTRVVRIDEHQDVGPRCLAFDDKHRDRDLNELVLEERRVELWQDTIATVRAFNVHTVMLARGSGCTLSYVLVTGDGRSDAALIVGDDTASARCPERERAMVGADNEALRGELAQGTPALPPGAFIGVTRHATHNVGLPPTVRATECVTFGPTGQSYCPRGDVAVLFPSAHSAMPLLHPDALEMLGHRFDYREPTSNTQRNTRRVRALYAVSATVVLPPATTSSVNAVVHSLLRNHDCATSVRLGSQYDEVSPLAIAVPAAACGAWRWAAEGVPLLARPDSRERTCRGGDDSGIVSCTREPDVCAAGGQCAAAPAEGGVAYPYAWRYYECVARGVRCDRPRADAECCDERVRRWFAYANRDLVYEE